MVHANIYHKRVFVKFTLVQVRLCVNDTPEEE